MLVGVLRAIKINLVTIALGAPQVPGFNVVNNGGHLEIKLFVGQREEVIVW